MASTSPTPLRATLDHTPVPLRFGTSGRRGEVVHLTQLEIYINVRAELDYLQSLSPSAGGIARGDEFYFAYDLRPSSTRFVPEQAGRGELAQAVARAIEDAGMKPVNLGHIPTPALTYHALQRGRGSIMVTGSHIPFDRNGYKTNSSAGELRKADEAPIAERVGAIRSELYSQAAQASLFGPNGLFKAGSQPLPPERSEARELYLRRYLDFFGDRTLEGKRLLVYEHSAVGRDLLTNLLRRLGAEPISVGRSESFVPIDTENIEASQLAAIQALANEAWRSHGPLDAVVSMDGDSDRPLLLSAEPDGAGGCRVRFFGGDLVGMVVATFLHPDAVVVPISCNDAVDRGPLAPVLRPKTRIGSPYVLAAMDKARLEGRRAVCGWEANGGFLTGSDFVRNGRALRALPTRDAMLPLLAVLFSMTEQGRTLAELFDALPRRYSRAGLLRQFPRTVGQQIVAALTPADARIQEARFDGTSVNLQSGDGHPLPQDTGAEAFLLKAQAQLEELFRPLQTGPINRLNFLDGIRIWFASDEIAHLRPSGNADEMRIYAVANEVQRAEAIVQLGLSEPAGILRKLESIYRCA